MKHTPFSRKMWLSATVVALLLAGCAETLDTHGTVVPQSQLAKVVVGQSTKDEVRQLLGTPSATGTLNDDRWYYVTSVVGKKAFNPHDLKSRRVLVLDFDPSSSVVTALNERTERDGKEIDPNRAATGTAGQTMGFIEQMFSNFGVK
ncbi:MAG: outer membrane protein assembly factor BamE [Alphaproteobacteria bacterium]|jgi:outer membrane protein assembly factor BamE (lipoprotein component of BamABCDE complex)|nr:outer membrane protein assembly factor BamE [Alphaproteobacteria bacterium]